jgi:phenylalanyl-tRNA synthetase beta chain
LHAFDFDRLSGRRIVVRRARDGETLETLDGIERELVSSDLIIADETRAVALAGVMGGMDTSITDVSTNVLLEGAWFDPSAVRATAQRLNLHTDASHRFERTPARDGMLRALDRAATLIVELAGGELAAGTLDVAGPLPDPVATELRTARLAAILGIDVAAEDIEDILGRLGFEVAPRDDGYRVQVPSFRPDVTGEEDLIEEVGRHMGYDRLPATLPVIPASEEAGTPEVLGEQRLKRLLAAGGCHEAMSSSLSSVEEQSPFLDGTEELVRLGNPISESLASLRAHLTPGLLTAVAFNINHGQSDLRLFELGRRFTGPLTDEGVTERWGLAIATTGHRSASHWGEQPTPLDFFDLKGTIESVTEQMAWPAWSWEAGVRAGLDPSATAILRIGDGDDGLVASGWAGRVLPETARAFDIDAEVWVAEVDIDDLLVRPHPTARHRPISRFPGGTRDVALVLPREVAFGAIRGTTLETATAQGLPLASLSLVEIYVGEEIPPDSRGMTLRFVFRADDRTLTAEEIDAGQRTLVDALARAHGARQR